MAAAVGGIDWGFWGFLATVFFGMWAIVYAQLPYFQGELEKDPEFRREIAGRLRDAGLGERYRGSLERALAWLDRVFGEPGSARALGVCILVAVFYFARWLDRAEQRCKAGLLRRWRRRGLTRRGFGWSYRPLSGLRCSCCCFP